jgi:hypothetical protein
LSSGQRIVAARAKLGEFVVEMLRELFDDLRFIGRVNMSVC